MAAQASAASTVASPFHACHTRRNASPDVAIKPTQVGEAAAVEVRALSSALRVKTPIRTGAPGTSLALTVHPDLPQCIGKPDCSATVAGSVPIDLVPPLTGTFPLVRTVRIVEPANYARTVLIELLRQAHFVRDYQCRHCRSRSLEIADEMRAVLGPDPEAWR